MMFSSTKVRFVCSEVKVQLRVESGSADSRCLSARMLRRRSANGGMNLRKLVVCSCLVACYLFSHCISFAQNVSQAAPFVAEQTVALLPDTLTDLAGPSGSESSASAAEETPPPADPQSQGTGNASGG